MRTAYRVLAYLVAVEVVIQAAAIAYAFFGESKFISDGGVINKAVIESQSAEFDGVLGFAVHGINGQLITPLIVVLLLVVSFFAKVRGGVRWAAVVVVLVALQVVLGIFGGDIPFLGLLHGLNALAVFTCAIIAARHASARVEAPVTTGATSIA
ncbi:DUF6220 domain-containing protein [Pseudonocardia sp. GCM10023141]|uniref:DUF6220 domain-containing protein n=1 Tax=Pseudonocardia sp. GCM10023141 TaxID=3252653 RepID=UPI0036075C05